MSVNDVVRARIDPAIKQEAATILATIGLTVSDAFRLLLTRVAHDKALPFEPLRPNAQTIAAMREARRGAAPAFATVGALLHPGRNAHLFEGRDRCRRPAAASQPAKRGPRRRSAAAMPAIAHPG